MTDEEKAELEKLRMQVASLHGVIAGTSVGTYTPESAVEAADKIIKEGMSQEQLEMAEKMVAQLGPLFEKLGMKIPGKEDGDEKDDSTGGNPGGW